MAITIKSEREIELMAEAGKILERVHNELEKALHPGMSTKDIDTLGEEIIRSYGCIPSFLNYNGYPASICVSVNDEIVHGIPNKHRILKDGDIVSIQTNGERALIMNNVLVRAGEGNADEVHIDTDEANACNLDSGMMVEIITK